MIARALAPEEYDEDLKSSNYNNSDTDNGKAETLFPCIVVNRFACPYEKDKRKDKKFDVDDLFALERIASVVESAFFTAYSMSKSNEIVYEADFKKDVVKEIRTLYGGGPWAWDIEYPLEEKLAEVKRLSIIPIRNVNDVHEILTDGEKLGKILEQGLDEQYIKYKEEFVKFLESIKQNVKIEDLRVAEPVWKSSRPASECVVCKQFANIQCVNCYDVWLCVDHWKQHGSNRHLCSIA